MEEDDFDVTRDSGADNADIQEILDEGYERLDQFMQWGEETLGLDARTVQQDCFNAESLTDYLANSHRKRTEDINEFELRWFLFSHYIRRAMADIETEERLPDSLRRYFEYLRSEHAYNVPDWLYAGLDDRAFYEKRLRDFRALPEDDMQWKEGFQQWSEELEDDLDTRCLLMLREIGDGLQWQDPMGWREATLYEEANRVWQTERAELLFNGLDYEAARERLTETYLGWMQTPQGKLDDDTPLEVIIQERNDREEEEETPDTDDES